MATQSSILAWIYSCHGQRSLAVHRVLVGPQGCKEWDMTEPSTAAVGGWGEETQGLKEKLGDD